MKKEYSVSILLHFSKLRHFLEKQKDNKNKDKDKDKDKYKYKDRLIYPHIQVF